MKLVIDSSVWIQYLSGEAKASQCAKFFASSNSLLTPSIVVFEVCKKIKKTLKENDVALAITQMSQTQIVALDDSIAIRAADLAVQYQLAMADAVVYATTLMNHAKLVTADNDFRNLPNVLMI